MMVFSGAGFSISPAPFFQFHLKHYAGFYGVRMLARSDAPWRMARGIEFRSVTVEAFKGKEGPCLDRNQAVIYKGPFKEVGDDDGHRLRRGVREVVCDKTFQIYTRKPYAPHFFAVSPRKEVPLAKAQPFDCHRQTPRHPRETKGSDYRATSRNGRNGDCGCGPSCDMKNKERTDEETRPSR